MLDANIIRYGRKKKENPSFWKFDIYQLNWRARFPGRVSLPSQKLSSLIIRLFNSSCQRYCSISRCHTLTPFSFLVFSFFCIYWEYSQGGRLKSNVARRCRYGLLQPPFRARQEIRTFALSVDRIMDSIKCSFKCQLGAMLLTNNKSHTLHPYSPTTVNMPALEIYNCP